MTSPAQRYAAARRRQAEESGPLGRFRGWYDFPLDPFQEAAARALAEGRSVLVAAPTGAGKTVVGEFAVHLALEQERKCFYTTPIKALSNQKYVDLVRRYGPGMVGLLTGDNSINGEAPIVVMTTEVLRNMLYAGSSTLLGLGYVVLDEVHYLADRERGAVWEEVIIHLPESVQLACLSATVSNAEEFGEWLNLVRGATDVVVEEHRPVPLWQHVLVGTRLLDLFVERQGGAGEPARRVVNPELVQLARDEQQAARAGRAPVPAERGRRGRPPVTHPRGGRAEQGRRGRRPADPGGTGTSDRRGRAAVAPPTRPQLVDRLAHAGLLPAIVFVFSRAGTDAAVEACLRAGVRLTTDAERERIRALADERCAGIPPEDRTLLGYLGWRDALERGVAAHHAGMLPPFKEVVEELFTAGLVKVVFATETLALGINMPARSVVLDRLVKWNGQTHAEVTPGEYTQLTGRAGRRGIDVEGHAIVVWSPGMDPHALAGLASTRTYPLRSSFRPSYNMAVNLVGQLGRERARGLLETSFAQFQADRSVVGIARQVARNEETLAGYREAMSCDRGDVVEYVHARHALAGYEAAVARRSEAALAAAAARSVEGLRAGDVIIVPSGPYAGVAVVVDPGRQPGRGVPRPVVVTGRGELHPLTVSGLTAPVVLTGHLRLPVDLDTTTRAARRALGAQARETAERAGTTAEQAGPGGVGSTAGQAGRGGAGDETLEQLRAAVRTHPVHRCPDRDDHLRWAGRFERLQAETEALSARMARRTDTVGRTFDRVLAVLDEIGYLDGERVTPPGQRLARLYGELDLVAAQCLHERLWDELGPPELAACAAALVYAGRRPDDAGPPRLPGGRVREVLTAMVRLWGDLTALEDDNQLSLLRPMDLGLTWGAFRWAQGAGLAEVLVASDLTAGDFVRWIRQVIDLLGQIADAAGEQDVALAASARSAVDAVRRGVVAYSSVA